MATVMRMSRWGTKKRPYYHIVIADSRKARDGTFIEQVGSFNPLLANDNPDRVKFQVERVQHWLSRGVQPSDRVARFLHAAGLGPKPVYTVAPKKSAPRAKTQERLKAAEAAASGAAAPAAPAAAAPAAAPAPAAEAKAEG